MVRMSVVGGTIAFGKPCHMMQWSDTNADSSLAFNASSRHLESC